MNCSAPETSCTATRCCSDPSKFCFQKNEEWATCKYSCAAGVHLDDGENFRTPWECIMLGSKKVSLTTMHWNVHWQCSRGMGTAGNCRVEAGKKFVELSRKAGAHVVAAIELAHQHGDPLFLPELGLTNWTQVSGPCKGYNDIWDSVALALAPGWQVVDSGGGCISGANDPRAFAVARVKPPLPVHACPELCIVALHSPHGTIVMGKDIVAKVCGKALEGCAVAMGDWNVPIAGGFHGGVANRWSELLGGPPPAFMLPNDQTCCFPESQNHGHYDHIATNIAGVHTEGRNGASGYVVHPYPVTWANPVEEHRPLSVYLQLPGAQRV